MAETPQEKIERASAALFKPAGPSARFESLDRIRDNHVDFVLECHKTWKHWHEEAVRQVLIWDGFLWREQTNPIGPEDVEFGNYNRALWRRTSDAIVWSLFGTDRHVVKRFCFYRSRTFLVESNADAAMSAVAALNANPLSIALWTDATSCVDVGDIIYVENGREPVPRFIELKEGEVNEEIMDIMELEGAEFQAKFQEFSQRRDKSGIRQFHRVLRQKRTADQAFALLANDRGTDPITGKAMEVVELDVDEETYDLELNEILMDAQNRSAEVIDLVACTN